MITWIKPNGTVIDTNAMPETIAYVESLGWKRKQAETEIPVSDDQPKKKPGRPRKEA